MLALRPIRFVAALGLVLSTLSCSSEPTLPKATVHRMGDRVTTGPVTYQGLTAEYRTELQGAKEPLKNRYLLIRLAATNSSQQEVSLPHTRLISSDGTEIPELTEMDGFPDWLGILRTLGPQSSEQGYVVFDVPVGAYKLEVASGGDPSTEKIAHIEIPTNLQPPTPSSVSGPALGN